MLHRHQEVWTNGAVLLGMLYGSWQSGLLPSCHSQYEQEVRAWALQVSYTLRRIYIFLVLTHFKCLRCFWDQVANMTLIEIFSEVHHFSCIHIKIWPLRWSVEVVSRKKIVMGKNSPLTVLQHISETDKLIQCCYRTCSKANVKS